MRAKAVPLAVEDDRGPPPGAFHNQIAAHSGYRHWPGHPKSKPHPAIFEHAASLSVAPKENCIVIEDSTNGIQAAVSAGIYCVGYDSFHSKDQDLSKANVVIRHFNELNFEKVRDLN